MATKRSTVAVPAKAPLNADQAKARLRAAAAVERKDAAKRAIPLAALLGQPQPYPKYPGFYFRRPKLGEKLDLLRQYRAVLSAPDAEDANADLDFAGELVALFAPYGAIEEEGTLTPTSAEDLLYRVFEDEQDPAEFANAVLNGVLPGDQAAAAEGAGDGKTDPNA